MKKLILVAVAAITLCGPVSATETLSETNTRLVTSVCRFMDTDEAKKLCVSTIEQYMKSNAKIMYTEGYIDAMSKKKLDYYRAYTK